MVTWLSTLAFREILWLYPFYYEILQQNQNNWTKSPWPWNPWFNEGAKPFAKGYFESTSKTIMKIMRTFTKSLIIMLGLLLSCGSLKTNRIKEKNVETKVNLPPNVPSNKYSKKRNF